MMGGIEPVEWITALRYAAPWIALAVVSVGYYWTLRAQCGALTRRLDLQRTEIAGLQHGLQAAERQNASTVEALRELGERLALVAREHERLLIRDADNGPYIQAARAARAGVDAATLVATYGLSHGEAELVVALHRPPPPP